MKTRSFLEFDFVMSAPQPDKQLVQDIFNKLADRYEEPGRHYHTLSHIQNGLRVYYQLFNRVLEPTMLFPWMYHDSVYDSRASDNEQRSGVLWMRDAKALGFSTEDAEQGNSYILATDPSAEPISVLNDMDLAELGATPEVFDSNTDNIRKEYDWVEPEVWRKGRIAVLAQFLKRDRLYITQPFADKFTDPAIDNLKRAIIKLSET
jgi:predicted metal-dependent HD superfamily phosphohydrolase